MMNETVVLGFGTIGGAEFLVIFFVFFAVFLVPLIILPILYVVHSIKARQRILARLEQLTGEVHLLREEIEGAKKNTQ